MTPRIPPISRPVIEPDGRMNREWYVFFERQAKNISTVGALADLPGGSLLPAVVTRCNAITQGLK